MAGVHQFAYGWITPVLAYLLSAIGSLLGLTATMRARAAATTGLRARWLILAAFAIGGTGIWTMHFLAMVGFAVDGTPVRFDVPITVASWLAAVLVVGVGLFLVGFGRPSLAKVVPAGVLTGAGVAAMHYSGMAAMRLNGTIGYDRRYVIAAVAIAVVAATVALWFTVTVRRPAALVASALIMGVAVSGMHYTGMFGLRVHVHEELAAVPGTEALSFLLPILILVLVVMVALVYSLLAVPSQDDREIQAELRARIDGSHPDTRPAPYAPTRSTPASGTRTPPRRPAAASGFPSAGGAYPEAGAFGGVADRPGQLRQPLGRPAFGAPEWTAPTDSYPDLTDDWQPRHNSVLPDSPPRDNRRFG